MSLGDCEIFLIDTWHIDTEPLEDGWCALHQSFEHLEIVKYLVEECVYVLIPIRKTAMEKLLPSVQGAIENGCSEVVVYLILIEECRVDKEAKTTG